MAQATTSQIRGAKRSTKYAETSSGATRMDVHCFWIHNRRAKDIPEVISETGKIGMPHKGEKHHFAGDFHDFHLILNRDDAEDMTTLPPTYKHQLRWVCVGFTRMSMSLISASLSNLPGNLIEK
jgi:hypothetical protein